MKIENVEYCMNLYNVYLFNELLVIVIFFIYRYYLCGNLKFDEFFFGVSLVCFFFVYDFMFKCFVFEFYY